MPQGPGGTRSKIGGGSSSSRLRLELECPDPGGPPEWSSGRAPLPLVWGAGVHNGWGTLPFYTLWVTIHRGCGTLPFYPQWIISCGFSRSSGCGGENRNSNSNQWGVWGTLPFYPTHMCGGWGALPFYPPKTRGRGGWGTLPFYPPHPNTGGQDGWGTLPFYPPHPCGGWGTLPFYPPRGSSDGGGPVPISVIWWGGRPCPSVLVWVPLPLVVLSHMGS